MSELTTLEAKLHAVLLSLETKLQDAFGLHPSIATHVAEAKADVSAIVTTDGTSPGPSDQAPATNDAQATG
jgi:hypothetical protein